MSPSTYVRVRVYTLPYESSAAHKEVRWLFAISARRFPCLLGASFCSRGRQKGLESERKSAGAARKGNFPADGSHAPLSSRSRGLSRNRDLRTLDWDQACLLFESIKRARSGKIFSEVFDDDE